MLSFFDRSIHREKSQDEFDNTVQGRLLKWPEIGDVESEHLNEMHYVIINGASSSLAVTPCIIY